MMIVCSKGMLEGIRGARVSTPLTCILVWKEGGGLELALLIPELALGTLILKPKA